MSDTALRAVGLSKKYRIGRARAPYNTLRESLVNTAATPFRRVGDILLGRSLDANEHEEIWALKDVSFEVKRGEVVGIIGRNGAGKSTLLKILSRITKPTEGYADIYGRVGSLLEVGTGFHPELTGRENIYLSGAILGMKRAEMECKFDEIVDFSGVEKFIDTPVKHFSSGMYLRLAFAVAAHLDPEVLLVDEVLAVGDEAFQRKCLGKMESVAGQGRTVLFVSHNMSAVNSLCQQAILLENATIAKTGNTEKVINEYVARTFDISNADLLGRVDRTGNGDFRFTAVTFVGAHGKPVELAVAGQPLDIVIDYTSDYPIDWQSLVISVGFRNHLGQFLFNCPSNLVSTEIVQLAREGSLVCHIPKLPLPEGDYRYNLFSSIKGMVADWIQDAGRLRVQNGDFFGSGKISTGRDKGILVDFSWRPSQSAM